MNEISIQENIESGGYSHQNIGFGQHENLNMMDPNAITYDPAQFENRTSSQFKKIVSRSTDVNSMFPT
jgi:hypothetical protein